MTWHHAITSHSASIRRALCCAPIAALLVACGPSEVSDETTAKEKTRIVWLDNLTTPGDILQPDVVNDQRREVFEEQDAFAHGDPHLPTYPWLRSFAQESGVVLIRNQHLTERQPFDPRLLKYPEGTTHGVGKNLCPGQRYENQPGPGVCSATLIDDDLLLTAAHCIFGPGSPDPEDLRAVFNHYNIATDALADIECDTPAGQICESQDVFRVRPILVGDRFADVHEDWALVQLVDVSGASKPAARFRPAPVRLDGTPSELETTLAKVGAPSGLPLKIALSKEVQGQIGGLPVSFVGVAQITDKTYLSFVDTFRGDSGGGVYDAESLELVALVSGGPNFVASGVPGLPDGPTDFVPRLPRPDPPCNIAGVCPVSAQRRQELEDAGISVLCNDTDGTLFPETFVRVDVALSLCGIGTGVPPVPFFQPPPGYESERLCGRTSNDTCDTAEPFELKVNHEITLSGDTSDFSDDVDVSCGNTTGSPDAFYTFEVPAGKRVMFYADTFGPGNTFDTVLFLQEGCPGTTEVACNDDASLCPGEGSSPLFRSRFALPLDAGTYFLGIAGFGAASGRYSIHVQALELSDNGILLNASQLGTPLFIDENTNNSAASQSESFCGLAGSKDFQVLYATCPDYAGGPIFASTCDPLTSFDTVLSFEQGSRPFTGCQDDMLVPGCFRQSELGFTRLVRANSGSGIRSLYVDGFSPADAGRFGLNVTFPP